MFGAPNSDGQLLAADRSRSRRSAPSKTLSVAEIEKEERFLASLVHAGFAARKDGADVWFEYARGEMFISLTRVSGDCFLPASRRVFSCLRGIRGA
jgi:hypothetical protein